MQPGTNPDDLQTILSRFHTWAEQHPGSANGKTHANGNGIAGIRELTYEEALAQHRRQAPPRERRKPARAARETAPPPATPGEIANTELPPATIAPTGEMPPAEPQLFADLPEPDIATPGAQTLASPEEKLPVVAEERVPANARTIAAPQAAKHESENAPASLSTIKTCARNQRVQAKAPVAAKTAQPARKVTASAHSGTKSRAKASSQAATPSPIVALKAVPAATAQRRSAASRPTGKKLAPKAAPRAEQHPEFRQVLAKSVCGAAKKAAGKKTEKAKKVPPERTRRITTRFSSAEERRLEKSAGQAGMTISAYLRKCALAAEHAEAAHPVVPVMRKKRSVQAEPPVEMRLFTQPAPTSLVGGWLTLLRQRFLTSPSRFAERA
ncbi:MAG TPA: hypothetical protein VHX37_11895 [Acidobacteriaceae bacterium]|jgi:hypothetical protein|nr:hypothetical protein [Acidobacteriaceae bacterium]